MSNVRPHECEQAPSGWFETVGAAAEAFMNITTHDLFAEHYVAIPPPCSPAAFQRMPVDEVQVLHSRSLARDVVQFDEQGFLQVGRVEFAARGNRGVGQEARVQAAAVGAAVVLVQITPAKLRAVRKRDDGSIDLGAVLADPPASLSPRGYYVVQAMFLAKAAPNEA